GPLRGGACDGIDARGGPCRRETGCERGRRPAAGAHEARTRSRVPPSRQRKAVCAYSAFAGASGRSAEAGACAANDRIREWALLKLFGLCRSTGRTKLPPDLPPDYVGWGGSGRYERPPPVAEMPKKPG